MYLSSKLRFNLIKIHTMLGVFFLPLALMFLISGALYTFDVKGELEKLSYRVERQAPIVMTLDVVRPIVEGELAKRGIALPENSPKIKRKKGRLQFRWSDMDHRIRFSLSADPNIGFLRISTPSLYHRFAQLHFANGSLLFKIIAAVMVIVLIVQFLMGIVVSLRSPKMRKLMLVSLLTGFGVFAVLVVVG